MEEKEKELNKVNELIELVVVVAESMKNKLKKQSIDDPEYFFWNRYIEMLDKIDEVKNPEDMRLLTEANLLRVLSILVPHWNEFKKI
jgi:hypothetical protein